MKSKVVEDHDRHTDSSKNKGRSIARLQCGQDMERKAKLIQSSHSVATKRAEGARICGFDGSRRYPNRPRSLSTSAGGGAAGEFSIQFDPTTAAAARSRRANSSALPPPASRIRVSVTDWGLRGSAAQNKSGLRPHSTHHEDRAPPKIRFMN